MWWQHSWLALPLLATSWYLDMSPAPGRQDTVTLQFCSTLQPRITCVIVSARDVDSLCWL